MILSNLSSIGDSMLALQKSSSRKKETLTEEDCCSVLMRRMKEPKYISISEQDCIGMRLIRSFML